LVGEEPVVFVAEDGFELVGSGGHINLVVDGLEFAAGDFCAVVAVIGVDDQLNGRNGAWHSLAEVDPAAG